MEKKKKQKKKNKMMTTGLKPELLHAGSWQIHWDAGKILKAESQSCVRLIVVISLEMISQAGAGPGPGRGVQTQSRLVGKLVLRNTR